MNEYNQIFLKLLLLYWFEVFQLNEAEYSDFDFLCEPTYQGLLELYFLQNEDGHTQLMVKYFLLEKSLILQ